MHMNIYIFLISPGLCTFSKYILHIALGGIKGEYIRLNQFDIWKDSDRKMCKSIKVKYHHE